MLYDYNHRQDPVLRVQTAVVSYLQGEWGRYMGRYMLVAAQLMFGCSVGPQYVPIDRYMLVAAQLMFGCSVGPQYVPHSFA
jgi:hypothetical protein